QAGIVHCALPLPSESSCIATLTIRVLGYAPSSISTVITFPACDGSTKVIVIALPELSPLGTVSDAWAAVGNEQTPAMRAARRALAMRTMLLPPSCSLVPAHAKRGEGDVIGRRWGGLEQPG